MPWQYEPPSDFEDNPCVHYPGVKIKDFVKLTTVIVITHYDILTRTDGHAGFLEMLTGQEFSRIIFVVISCKPGEDTAEKLLSTGDVFPKCRSVEYIQR